MMDLANQVIPQVCPMWDDIGRQLKLNIATLNEIRANCHGDVRQCCSRMFEVWLKQDTEASWITVMSACTRVKQNLESSLVSSPHQPHTKDHIEALDQLAGNLCDFLTKL